MADTLEISIRWAGAAPQGVRIRANGTTYTPTIASAIAEMGSGAYAATINVDSAWAGAQFKDWWIDENGEWWPGDGMPAVNVVAANSKSLTLLSNLNGLRFNAISPTDIDGRTVLTQGDDYINGNLGDRRLTYTVTGYTGTITNATVTWRLVQRKAYDKRGTATAELAITSGTASLVGQVLTLKVPVTRTQTAALTDVSEVDTDYRYKVQVALVGNDGETLTEVLADAVVLKKVS